jgi:type I restriction enzyme, S subunit
VKAGWNVAKLGAVCHKITDGSHNPPSGVGASNFMMLSSKNVFNDEITLDKPRFLSETDFNAENRRTEVSENDVLLTVVGTVGRAAVVPHGFPPITLQRSVAVLKPSMTKITPRFLMFALHSILDDLIDGARGVAQKGIYLKALREVPISLPPLEEQQRIVAVLDEAFEGLARARAHTEANLSDAEEISARALDALLDELRLRNGEVQISRIAEVKGGKRLPKGVKPSPNPTPFPYISVKDLTENGSVTSANIGYISAEVQRTIARYTISCRDVYVSIAGTIGKSGIVPPELDGANLTENAAKLVLQDGWETEYIYWCTRSSNFSEQTSEQTRTAAQPKLALQRLGAICIPKATAIEQAKVIEIMNKLRETRGALVSTYLAKLQDLDDLRQSLLQKAFAGELT